MKGQNTRYNKNKKIFFPAIIIIIIIIIAVGLLTVLLNKTVHSSVYEDRKVLLARLTETNAGVVDDSMNYCQSIIDMISDEAFHDIPGYENFGEYLGEMSQRSSYNGIAYFFVDNSGRYFSSDGKVGKVVDITYYTDSSEDKLSYISNLPHLDPTKSYLIYRNRFSSPVNTVVDGNETELLYCGYLYDLDELNNVISQSFAGDNNTFIYDNTSGVMLYKNFGLSLLLDGYNIYPKFSKSTIVFGDSDEDLVSECENRETVIALLEIGGEQYYFCSAPISHRDWSISFIVQGKTLDENSGNSFTRVILYCTLIAVVLGAAIVFAIVIVYKKTLSEQSLKEITELNKDLERATQAKSDFLSNMSHDIRTPINGVMGMTAIAKGVEGNPEKTVKCLDKIETASKHLLSLVNDVLDMSRIEQGKTEIVSKPMDIRAISNNCESIINGQIGQRNLNLVCEVNCEHPKVLGDELHLKQIFINILGNSVKFTHDGGTIRFLCNELSSSNGKAIYSFVFEDNGIGMKPEFLEKLFEPFVQEEGGARSQYKGTGLGMTIVKQLTELMGGTISVESAVNEGTTFTLTIPLEINTDESVDEIAKFSDADIHGVKVLLAEDNELNMEIAVELLEDAGAIITAVENGKAALEKFENSEAGSFDVILMDVMMPVMNGIDATKAIRALSREDAKSIPILAMTANAFESDIKATTEAGMNAHLVKPIDIKEVLKTIAFFTK